MNIKTKIVIGINIFFLGLVLFITQFVSFPIVSGHSMEPTLKSGEILLLDKTAEFIQRYDIVVAKSSYKLLIKRVIGLPGETISFKNGVIYVNGEPTDYSFANDEYILDGGILKDGELKLDLDEYFIVGDNRNHSSDSREIGPVKVDAIQGVIKKVILDK